MAVYRYATKDLSINNAKAFISAVGRTDDGRNTKNSVVLYAVLGNVFPYPNEPTPVLPGDNEQYLQYEAHREFIGGKRITSGDISHVAPRYNWTSGTVYSMYRDTDEDMYDRVYYVLTNEFNVYKCLYNNKGGQSTVKPTGYSTSAFTTSDGYTWKYIYTISLGEANKFLTAVHMPVKTIVSGDGSPESTRQLAVQNAAVNGSIEIVETVNIGSNYLQIANGVVEQGGARTFRLSTTSGDLASPVDNIYNGSSVYIINGTGSGQLRRIIDYSGATRTFTVNTSFSTTPNTDSRVIVSPTCTIIGDGSGAKAYTRVDVSTGAISNVSIIDTGRDYTGAIARITANSIHGTGATANVVISPVGGHGSDPIRELAADKVLMNIQFNKEEGVPLTGAGYIPSNTEFRSITILKDPVLKVNSNNVLQSVEAIANSSNSPSTLRFTTRLDFTYTSEDPDRAFLARDILTNERMRLRAELGTLEFVTTLGSIARRNEALANAKLGANGNIVYVRDAAQSGSTIKHMYINNVQTYADYPAFVKDDGLIISNYGDSVVGTVQSINGPEANTYSGKILYAENIQAVERDPGQTEDIKIILDF